MSLNRFILLVLKVPDGGHGDGLAHMHRNMDIGRAMGMSVKHPKGAKA